MAQGFGNYVTIRLFFLFFIVDLVLKQHIIVDGSLLSILKSNYDYHRILMQNFDDDKLFYKKLEASLRKSNKEDAAESVESIVVLKNSNKIDDGGRIRRSISSQVINLAKTIGRSRYSQRKLLHRKSASSSSSYSRAARTGGRKALFKLRFWVSFINAMYKFVNSQTNLEQVDRLSTALVRLGNSEGFSGYGNVINAVSNLFQTAGSVFEGFNLKIAANKDEQEQIQLISERLKMSIDEMNQRQAVTNAFLSKFFL